MKFYIAQVDYITLLCHEITDDALNLKCEACMLIVNSVVVLCSIQK